MLMLLQRCGAQQLLPVSVLLTVCGLVALFSASAGLGPEPAAVQGGFLARQASGIAVGTLFGVALFFAPPSWLRQLGYAAWAFSALLLWATLSPLGVVGNNAQRWLQLGPIVVQPLEIAKLGLVLGLASWFAQHGDRVLDVRYGVLGPALMIGLPVTAAILQPNFGGALLLVTFGTVLIFLAGARASHLLVSAAFAVPVLLTIGLSASYRVDRVAVFWDPFVEPLDRGYQLVQSLFAFGKGGVFGVGLGASQQKWSFLPEAHTDFILAVIGEELGLIGVGAVLIAFAVVGIASLGIASRSRDLHGQLIAAGAGMLLWLQAAINAGVAMARLPTTGTTLPLFSYGRSSMIVSLMAIGLILNVARPHTTDLSGWK